MIFGRRRLVARPLLIIGLFAAALQTLWHCSCVPGAASVGAAPTTAISGFARREALLIGLGLGAAGARPGSAQAASGSKAVVLGGSGFIGRRICERLIKDGVAVTSISRSGGPPVGSGAWADQVTWIKGDVLSMDLAGPLSGAEAVISAIGAIGSADDERLNGATAEAAASAAATAGAKRFVLVSATPLVAEAGAGAAFPGYVKGKQRAEAAVAAFPGTTTVLQPTFVFGGEEFSANPPRVAAWYGEKIEGLLGSGLVRPIASVSPAALKLALLPPNSVEDVAAAAVAGAVGKVSGVLSGHDAIKAAGE